MPPVVSPSDGVNSKTIGMDAISSMGQPVTISFTVMNEPVPPVTKEWVFTGSNGTVNLSCTSTPKYTFSDDCLNLTVNSTAASDAGLYHIILTSDAGIVESTVALAVSGGELCICELVYTVQVALYPGHVTHQRHRQQGKSDAKSHGML